MIGSIALATDSNMVEFAYDCPNLTSLTLQRFGLNDAIARVIIKVWAYGL